MSKKIVSDFTERYWNRLKPGIIEKLRTNQPMVRKDNQDRVTLLFDGFGKTVCQGLVSKADIGYQLESDIRNICRHDQINQLFANEREGLALLCAIVDPDLPFAQHAPKGFESGCQLKD